jgi:GNAT superfamily N-acetyltransferase
VEGTCVIEYLGPEEGYQHVSSDPVSPTGRSIHYRSARQARRRTSVPGESALTPSIGSAPITAFHPTFPSPDVYVGILSMMFSHPGFYCVVAESDGCMVGSNCLDERSAIAGLGPITVDPSIQNRGVGRKLMEAVLVRARERNFPGVRLLQSAFHNRSLALYSRLMLIRLFQQRSLMLIRLFQQRPRYWFSVRNRHNIWLSRTDKLKQPDKHKPTRL